METLTKLGPAVEAADQQPDDRALLDGFLNNDEQSFPAIIGRYGAKLTGYARRHLKRSLSTDAEDVVQETFADLFERRHDLLPETHLSGLLHHILERRCMDHLRRARAQKRDLLQTLPLDDARHVDHACSNQLVDPHVDPRRFEDQLDLDAMVTNLSADEAQAMRLYLEGHTAASAAEVMGEPLTHVEWCIRSAKTRLKRLNEE